MSFLSAKAAEEKSESFTVDMDRQQLADYLSVERSAMCAELSRLQKDGYLSYKGNRFRLSGRNRKKVLWMISKALLILNRQSSHAKLILKPFQRSR